MLSFRGKFYYECYGGQSPCGEAFLRELPRNSEDLLRCDPSLKEMLKVMQAAEDGEQIQSRHRDSPSGSAWIDRVPKHIVWNWGKIDYRVKPRPAGVWCYYTPMSEYPLYFSNETERRIHESISNVQWCDRYVYKEFKEESSE